MSSYINHVDLVKSVITPSPCFFTPHNSIHWKNVQQDSAFFFFSPGLECARQDSGH